MKLASRVSVFFLGTLAVVLVGFSTALYAIAWRYLYRQVDERLDAVLNTMAAAAELESGKVEWEPAERRLAFGRKTLEGVLRWWVIDANGRRIDGSADAASELVPQGLRSLTMGGRPITVVDSNGSSWRLLERELTPGAREFPPADHSDLVLGAGLSLEVPRATLRNLAATLFVLSCSLWLLALAIGRRLVGRALRPLARMAESARAFSTNDLGERLPTPQTGDELEDLGLAFNALLDRMQESYERQARFAGDASHQLRTPLTSIQGQVELALRKERDVREYQRVLGVVREQTLRLRRIVEALLFLARSNVEALDPQLESIDLGSWVSQHLENEAGERGGELAWNAPESPVWVRVQPALLEELIGNLLDNAFKYSSPGSVVEIAVSVEGNRARLAVSDEGRGIAPEDLPRLFDPFFRSVSARLSHTQGLGLGLSIAARLARSFGGEIKVTSELGKGSTFTVCFPLAVAETSSVTAIASLD